MIIERYTVGAGKRRHDVYAICNDPQPGDIMPREIVRFDSLEIAAIVKRYLAGDSLSEADEQAAKEAIKKADAPTVESKRDRTAE